MTKKKKYSDDDLILDKIKKDIQTRIIKKIALI